MNALASRFQRANAKLFGTAATRIPVPFEILCDCGNRIAGVRQTSHQQVVCSKCGMQRFVLPVNFYPTTGRVPSEVVGGPLRNRLLAAAREFFPAAVSSGDSSDSESGRRRTKGAAAADAISRDRRSPDSPPGRAASAEDEGRRNGSGTTRSGTRSIRGGTTDVPGSARAPQPGSATERTVSASRDSLRAARRLVTPFRLLMAGAVLIASLTGWWSWYRTRLENARQTWRDSMDIAEVALKEQRLPDLQSALQSAVDAARVLGRLDPEAQAASSLLLETQAVSQLSSIDLQLELDRALEKDDQLNAQRAQAVEAMLKTGWYVFECRLSTTDAEQALLQLDIPLQVGPGTAQLQVSSSLLMEATRAMPETPLVFVARVETCRPPDAADGTWVIRLDPVSCTLLTSVAHGQEAGLDFSDESPLSLQLERQKQFLDASDVFALRQSDHVRAEQRAQQQRQQEVER